MKTANTNDSRHDLLDAARLLAQSAASSCSAWQTAREAKRLAGAA